MDIQASQQIGNIVHDMEPEDAVSALSAHLLNFDIIVTIDGVVQEPHARVRFELAE